MRLFSTQNLHEPRPYEEGDRRWRVRSPSRGPILPNDFMVGSVLSGHKNRESVADRCSGECRRQLPLTQDVWPRKRVLPLHPAYRNHSDENDAGAERQQYSHASPSHQGSPARKFDSPSILTAECLRHGCIPCGWGMHSCRTWRKSQQWEDRCLRLSRPEGAISSSEETSFIASGGWFPRRIDANASVLPWRLGGDTLLLCEQRQVRLFVGTLVSWASCRGYTSMRPGREVHGE